MQKNKNILCFLFIFISTLSYYKHNLAMDLEKHTYGLNVYKKGNCMGCHSWHGKGGGGYGAGVSLRNMNLTLDEIKNVIKCGRPGTGMPYFLRKSYKEEKCYDTTFEDYDGSYRPISSKKFLNPRQIEAVSIFVNEVLQDKELNKDYCEFFFEKGSKVCTNLQN